MEVKRIRSAAAIAATILLFAPPPSAAQDLASFEKNVTVHRLDNGLTFLIYERPGTPVFSYFTHVDVGASQETLGITGMAHMFEHMAFKGTTRIGTTDAKAEAAALAKVDDAFAALFAERNRLGGPDPEKLANLEKRFKDAQEEAGKYIKANEFGEIIDREGGVGLNAFTNNDETGYFFSMPANKLELWAYLESERYLDPVFREFYKERDVVQEERRLRTESQPIGRMIEQFLGVAYSAHAYGRPVVGYMSDLQAFTRADAEAFYRKHYVPANMTISVVGAIEADEVIPLVEKYFGRLPERPKPEPLRTVEPPQIAEKSLVMRDPSQPIYVEGYHRAAGTHPDDAIYTAMADILSTGRASRMYRSLVRDKKVAAQTGAFNGFPGDKYPNLMLFFAIPAPGKTNDDVQAAIREEIEKLRNEPVTDEELQAVKTRAKANLIRGLDSNQGLANQLATYQARFGDWRELFRAVERIEAVTKEDILRVAKATFVASNRTVGRLENADAATGSN
jgi:predicted Zn-dependent peptidase